MTRRDGTVTVADLIDRLRHGRNPTVSPDAEQQAQDLAALDNLMWRARQDGTPFDAAAVEGYVGVVVSHWRLADRAVRGMTLPQFWARLVRVPGNEEQLSATVGSMASETISQMQAVEESGARPDLDSPAAIARQAKQLAMLMIHGHYGPDSERQLRERVAAVDAVIGSPPEPAPPPASKINPRTAYAYFAAAEAFAAATASEASGKVVPVADEPLNERQTTLLVALLNLGAFDADSRATSDDAAVEAFGPSSGRNDVAKVIADLSKPPLAMIETKGGRGGGVWLTAAGRKRAEKLKE